MQVQDNDDRMCMMRGCTEIDLLAARCRNCNKLFCTQHIAAAAHHCTHEKEANEAPICPLCNKPVAVRRGESNDFAVNRHIESGCQDSTAAQSQRFEKTATGGTRERMNFCSLPGCNKNEIQLMTCAKCGSSYCVDHRAPLAHKCPRLTPPPQARAVLPPTVPAVARTSPAKERNNAASPGAQKIPTLASMKFQNTIKGAFPVGRGSSSDGNAHIAVYFPFDANIRPAYFHVSPRMVIGRLIDSICTQVDLPRRDNHNLPEREKITLFNLRRNMLLPTDMPIEDGLDNGVSDITFLMISRGPELPESVVTEINEMEAQRARGASRTPTAPAKEGKKSECAAM